MAKREIHALDYAIVELVSALDQLFRFAVNPIALQIAGGLNTEVEEHSPIEMQVRVRPTSWPNTSWIFIRFQKNMREGEGSWKAFEGRLIARHLPEEVSEFRFNCEWDLNGYYRFGGKGTEDEQLFKRLLTARAATEIKRD